MTMITRHAVAITITITQGMITPGMIIPDMTTQRMSIRETIISPAKGMTTITQATIIQVIITDTAMRATPTLPHLPPQARAPR